MFRYSEALHQRSDHYSQHDNSGEVQRLGCLGHSVLTSLKITSNALAAMIKLPYGNSDFYSIRTEGYLYLDRTHHLPQLEDAGKQLLFLRPRRFGKSLLLSTLAHYYDINRANEFEKLFGDLFIGKNPTAEHNKYLILRWDFSVVSPLGEINQIVQNLFDHINGSIIDFRNRYQKYLTKTIDIASHNAISSFESLLSVAQLSGYKVYLLIDEYDNFANEVLMQNYPDEPRYKALLQGEGIFKTLFKTIKATASEGKIGRVFITGVSPVVMSDLTSGYNVVTNIYLDNDFNSLCGITQSELVQLVNSITTECEQDGDTVNITLEVLREFYNGYRFCTDFSQGRIYNPTLCFYYLRHWQKNCKAPDEILDTNLAMDAGKITYIANLPNGERIINQVVEGKEPLLLDSLENRFGIESLRTIQSGERFMVSLLYYFGVLTLVGRGDLGELAFGVPNLVIRALYVDELRKRILPDVSENDKVTHLARDFYRTANLQPLIEFMESKYFAVFNNRDYRWSNELTVKTAFLTLLFNDTYYVMDSESALQRRYSDLTMIVRSNRRQYALLDLVLEFKYLSLGDLGLTGEQVREQSRETLKALPNVQIAVQAALQQLAQYRQILIDKYQEPQRLRCLAVVALGFDRIVWELLP